MPFIKKESGTGKGIVIAHYDTDNYEPNETFLDDGMYGKALDTFVKACVDAVIIQQREDGMDWEMLLGKRNIEPYKNWWTFGGRMRAGETPLDSLFRNLNRDLKIRESNIRSVDFLTLGSFSWGTREQEPKNNGTCDIILFHMIQLTSQWSITDFTYTPMEYDEIQWVPFMKIAEERNGYHPALQALVRCIRQKMM
jgi:ADP-ribose pyrophosphatase YjhB (NUDIX family)